MAKADANPDALRRLGGGRWETKDGRFQIEPQSGTWVIVDTTQANEFGLPLVRGPFPSLGAAREAIEAARTEGPVESPLAERIEQARSSTAAAPPRPAAKRSTSNAAAGPTPKPLVQTEPEPPPDPAWLRSLQAGERRRAKELIARLEAIGIADAQEVARSEIVDDEPALARLAIERRLHDAVGSDRQAREAVDAALEVILEGRDDELGVEWRAVDGTGRPIRKLEPEA
jgi:hypothetical protein